MVGTGPQFTQQKTWLGSDYMTQSLGLDPTVTQKRLGDGFYEQKLIREQVAQLTGQRFLGDFQSDDQQFQALMNNNLGGKLSAEKLYASARQDLNNIGGLIDACSVATVTAERDLNLSTTTQSASNLEGQSVSISACQDLGVKGTNVLADQDVRLKAGGNVKIEAAQNTQSNTSFTQTTQSGVMSGGGV
jgi:large exoprotein involved in heme utilization and adhesion